KGDVRRVELQVEALRVERARADSQHAAQLDTVRALLAAVQDKIAAQQAYLVQLRGDMKTDLLAVQQQVVSVQELTGQSQARAPDALYFIGESFAGENPDSAAAVYQQVVKTYPNSSRAPSALYKLGLLAEQRGDKAAARQYFSRVIGSYPRSQEANLARDKLQRLGR